MRTWYVLMITAALSTATAASAHFPEGVTHLAFQFPDSQIPTIDGDLSDWEMLSMAYQITTEDIYEQIMGMGHAGVWPDLSDFSVTLMVGWNDKTNMLYAGAQTFDNVHMCLRPKEEPSLMWRQDDLEIMMDIDHSGGQYADFQDLTEEENKRLTGAQATLYDLAYPNSDGINIYSYTAATWDTDPPYFYAAFDYKGEGLGEGTTTYETAYTPWVDLNWAGPEGSIVGDLEEGQIIGLQFSFGDFDDPEQPSSYHAYWTVSGQDETFKYAQRFADFLLAPIEPWAVEPVKTEPMVAHAAEVKLTASDAGAQDYFGNSVSIDGDYAIVGAYRENYAGSESGSAYVFYRNQGGTNNWGQQAKLTALDAAAGDRFGCKVFITGDYAVVGAYRDDHAGGTDAGSAYVFVRDGRSWSQQAKLTANDAAAGDQFGCGVRISGEYAIVGARYDDHAGGTDAGSVYIFHRSGTSWTEQAKLTASDAAAGDFFGSMVSVSGDYVIVPAYWNDDGGPDSGSAYIFHRSGTSWTEQAKLVASDAAAGDEFGYSVSISGDYAIVGARYDDDGGPDSGSVYIFRRSGTSWIEQAKLAASDAAAGDWFGVSASISGNYVIVGAYRKNKGSGAAYSFLRSGSSWSQKAKITASDGEPDDCFGYPIYINEEYAIVGAYGDDHAGSDAGSAYIYHIDDLSLSPEQSVVGISKVSAAPDSIVTLPITVEDATGIAGADMVLTYDPDPLTLTDIHTTDLASGFALIWNEEPSGTVTIALAGSSEIAGGTGDLIELTFEVSERAPLGMVSRVRFRSCTLWDVNGDTLPSSTKDGAVILPRITASIPDTSALLGTSVMVPINVDDASGIAGANIDIGYDATVLTIGEITATDLSEGLMLTANTTEPGVARIALAGATGIAEGSGALVGIGLRIVEEAIIGTVVPLRFLRLDLRDELGEEIGAQSVEGSLTVTGILGDLNGDGNVNSGDAILVLRISVGLLTPTPNQQWAGDVYEDGEINSGDAILILRKAVGLPSFKRIPLAKALAEVTVSVSDATASPGEKSAVWISVSEAEGIAGGDLILTYNPGVLTAREVKGTALAAGLVVVSNASTPGEVKISLAGATGLPGGSGSLLEMIFDVREDAEAGRASPLRLTEVTLRDETGNPLSLGTISDGTFTVGGVSVEAREAMGQPGFFALSQNTPNPFNAATDISYQLPKRGFVRLTVYDLSGQLLRTLVEEEQRAGYYMVRWDGRDSSGKEAASGIYLYRLQTHPGVGREDFTQTRRMILLR